MLDAINQAMGLGTGPRVAFILGAAFFAVAAVLLRPVDPRRREDRLAAAAAA